MLLLDMQMRCLFPAIHMLSDEIYAKCTT